MKLPGARQDKGAELLCKLEWGKRGSRAREGGLKTGGRETLGSIVREIYVVFVFPDSVP